MLYEDRQMRPGLEAWRRYAKSRLLARTIITVIGATIADSVPARTQDAEASTLALKKLDLEELMNVEVTSVSRTAEGLYGAAAAIAVVTDEDIRRSGATTIPDALRGVPGVHVAQRNAGTWAVSSRGFSSSNSEKLLVLSDTRSLYTPLVSGVAWDTQQYLFHDIARVEVIRGPGAALWGSNAVNGVINITTKNARDTQGTYLEAAVGNEDEVIAGGRYGSAINEDLYVRVFGKHLERDGTFKSGSSSQDDWRNSLLGFRADWQAGGADALTLQGDWYRGESGQYEPSVQVLGRPSPMPPLNVSFNGGNVLGRWRRTLSDASDLQLRFYYDRTHRNDPTFIDTLDTYDVDLQHRFDLSSMAGIASQEIIWGVNYRFTQNDNRGKGVFALQPTSSGDSVISAFVQDQFPLGDDVRLTLGSKFEHNDFSGFEFQPSVRAAWEVARGSTLWAAVSRAARIPTRLERDVAIDVTNPNANPAVRLLGNEEFDSEELLAYELGYRWTALADVFVDLAAFYQRYEGLVSLELGTPFVDPRDGRIVIPIENRNLTDGNAQGIEALVTYVVRPNWRLSADYSYLDLELDPRGQDMNSGRLREGSTPRHQYGLRSSLDLTDTVQVDVQFRSLSAIRSLPESVTGEGLPGYSELNARIAWRVWEGVELSLIGQNLLHRRHTEFGAPSARGEIERSFYGKIAWEF
jgi:iron complex outermembrane recepter protein